MIKIKDCNFSCDIEDIVEKLREDAESKGKFLFSEIKLRKEYLSVTCPYHKLGHEKKPSAGFRVDNGYFSCFICSEKHSLIEVISHCLDISTEKAFEWLKENFVYNISKDISVNITPKKKQEKKKINYLDNSIMTKYRMFHPYMFERKMSKDTVRKYDIGFDKESQCIIFPNKDEKGNILFLAKRSVKTKFFHYPTDVDKPIYGLYELSRDFPDTKYTIITESMINCLTCRSWGYAALALNGTGSAEQLNKLAKLDYTTYTLALDGDEAGFKGTEKIIKKLRNKKLI